MYLPYELQKLKQLGYRVFEGQPYDLNMIGIRSPNRDQRANPFDDVIMIWYKDPLGTWICESWAATTDPMSHYLTSPMNPDGTAIMCEGQHRGLWKLGLHRGKPALVQAAPVKVYRDKDKDTIVEMDPASSQIGMFAINFHGGTGPYASAGCQVVPDWKYVDRVRELLELQNRHGYGESVTYTLVRCEDMY